MAKPAFDLEVTGDGALIAYFNKLGKMVDTPEMRQAMLDSSMVVEENEKKNLREMVYSKAERWYRRKAGAGLLGKTMASKKVGKKGSTLITGVISAVKHAIWVHFGTGIYAEGGKGRKTPWLYPGEDGKFHKTVGMEPKPFATKALKDSEKDVIQIINDALLK